MEATDPLLLLMVATPFMLATIFLMMPVIVRLWLRKRKQRGKRK